MPVSKALRPPGYRLSAWFLTLLALLFVGSVLLPIVAADPLPSSELQALTEYPNWAASNCGSTDAGSGGGACCSGSGSTGTTLTGSDGEEKTWNYFKGKGLSDGQVAGIVGNIQQESTFNPELSESGGNSTTQPTGILAGTNHSPGWGLAQWTLPFQNVQQLMQQYKIGGPTNDMGAQLDLIWAQMNGTSPTGVQDLIKGLPSDPAQAALYFDKNFEGGTDPGGVRESDAIHALQRYGGKSAPSGGTIGNPTVISGASCGTSASSSPDCQTATGVAKILCEAKKYDTTSYSNAGGVEDGHGSPSAWHQQCPTIGPSCYTDCSGLVNLAVYDAFGTVLEEDTFTEVSDTQYWKKIPLSQVQPGDLIQPAAYSGDHVEIIDHVTGNTIYTFGSHTSRVAQPDQVGPASFQPSAGDVYLHYIGQGA